jgi:hypothetical protein
MKKEITHELKKIIPVLRQHFPYADALVRFREFIPKVAAANGPLSEESASELFHELDEVAKIHDGSKW